MVTILPMTAHKTLLSALMDQFHTRLANYIHAVLAMHMPLHDDPNLRFTQAEQIASLIAAKLDHLKRHGTLTVDNTEYPIVTLSQQEYNFLRSRLQELQARCLELSMRSSQDMSNKGRLEQAESFLEAQRVQISSLQNKISSLKAENEILRYEPSEGEEEQDVTGMNVSSR